MNMKAYINHTNSDLLLVKMSLKLTHRSGSAVSATRYAFPVIKIVFSQYFTESWYTLPCLLLLLLLMMMMMHGWLMVVY